MNHIESYLKFKLKGKMIEVGATVMHCYFYLKK
jgi:hypothetical protein